MADALDFRRKFGVIAPSTNTSVQPEFDAMRPRGVTNHFGRIAIPNDPVHNDDVMTCEPDYLIMGMSSETFWDGLEGSQRLHQRVEARAVARLAATAELWLDKPVLAINTCIYWWSLRQNGIDDKIDGFGSLLLQH